MLEYDIQRLWLEDWDRSGWDRYFPAEGRFVWHALCDAARRDHVGGLGHALAAYLSDNYPVVEVDADRIVDFPLLVPIPRKSRRRIERLLCSAGHGYPETIGEVAHIGVELGLYHCYRTRGRTHWRAAPALPLPAEVFPLSLRQQQREDRLRWTTAAGFLSPEIVALLHRDGRPTKVVTSIERLSVRLDQDTVTVREGLSCLVDSGDRAGWPGTDMRAYAYDSAGRLRVASVDRLDTDEPCVLQPNWRRLSRRFRCAKGAPVA